MDRHYPGPYPVVKWYLEPGDKGENVIRLQNYLNWYTNGAFFKECGGADGVYGKNTLRYVNKMLTDFFGPSEADGKVGNKSIAKMKAYEKPAPGPTPGGHYTGKYPEVRVKRSIAEVLQYAIKWAIWIAANNDFHYGCGDEAHHNGCYFCGTQPASKKNSGIKMWEHTYCCNPFVHAALAHGGLIPRALKMCSEGRSWDFNKGSGYDACDLFDKLGKPSKSKLKPGDVLCNGGHAVLYIGDGKIAEASGGDDNVIHSKGSNNSIQTSSLDYSDFDRVYTLNTPVDADIIMRKGEVSERVADLQRYLIWYGALPADEEVDIYYGEKTYKAVVKMQTDFFGAKEADGTIGPKTIAKMKEYSKEEPTPSGGYTGPFPATEEIKAASNVGIRTRMCIWGRKIAADDRYRYVYFDEPYGEECALCHPHGGKNEGWQCIGLGAAVWHHGGCIPTACHCGVVWQGRGSTLDLYEASTDAQALALAQKHFGVKDLQIIRNRDGIPKAQWQMGDYCCQIINGNVFQHVFVYIGGDEIVDASSHHADKRKDIDVRSYSGYSAKVIVRYTGGFTFLQKYDAGDAVLKWQDYLNWWSDGQFYKECGKGDGVFGSNTDSWTKRFQEAVFSKAEADGLVGPKTIAAAQSVRK